MRGEAASSSESAGAFVPSGPATSRMSCCSSVHTNLYCNTDHPRHLAQVGKTGDLVSTPLRIPISPVLTPVVPDINLLTTSP